MKSREEYLKETNRLGRLGVLIMLVLLFAVPIIFGLYHNAMPTFKEFALAATGLLVLFVPIAISEVFIYTPIFGSATYITFITGNIMNLKVPIAQNAQELMNTTKGTDESDVITTLAISVSAIITITLIALGVLLLIPLEPIMTSESVSTAAGYVLPALFGALVVGLLRSTGEIRVKGKVKAGIVPFILLLLFNIFVMNTYDYSGILLIVMIPLTVFFAWILFKKKQITIEIIEREVSK